MDDIKFKFSVCDCNDEPADISAWTFSFQSVPAGEIIGELTPRPAIGAVLLFGETAYVVRQHFDNGEVRLTRVGAG